MISTPINNNYNSLSYINDEINNKEYDDPNIYDPEKCYFDIADLI